MIEVVNLQGNAIPLSTLLISSDDFFGVEFKTGTRGYIQALSETKMAVKTLHSFIKSNRTIHVYDGVNVHAYIEYLISQNRKVFKFEKASEMMEWVEKGEREF